MRPIRSAHRWPCPAPILSTLTVAYAALLAELPAQVVFRTDFDGALPAEIQPGRGQLEPVQGFAGLGSPRRRFGGSFLRSPTGNTVAVQLTNLPPHRYLQLDCLFAAIDSLDGAWFYPPGDWLRITVDGRIVFRQAFANDPAFPAQTYQPPPGAVLARQVDLGFSGPGAPFQDSAYDFGADPWFLALPHHGSTARIEFTLEGPAHVPLADESWALDNLEVRVGNGTEAVAVPYGPNCGVDLQVRGAPALGSSVAFHLHQVPSHAVAGFGAFGFDAAWFGGAILPMPLGAYGAPSCWLLQDLAAAMFLSYTANWQFTLPIPNATGLLDAEIYHQAWLSAPGSNPGGLLTSQGVRLWLGQPNRPFVEDFTDASGMDAAISGDRWQNGARPGLLGGDGRHGSFEPSLGNQTAPQEYTFDTALVTIPAERSLDGQVHLVTDGRLYFTDFVVPAGVTVHFVGPLPPQIFVRGQARIDGTLSLDGAAMTNFNAVGVLSTVAPVIQGQPGGAPGAGGGRGGQGGNECQGTGPAGCSGANGEDVRLLAGHAYAASSANTGGRGAPMHPPTGPSNVGVPNVNTGAILSAFRSFFAFPGGGGGFTNPGAAGSVAPLAGLQLGANPGPANALSLFPYPPVSPPVGYSSLNHFLVGGSGGGGGGSHPFGNLVSTTSPPNNLYCAGSGGSGGGGAMALRTGGDLQVAASATLQARGGRGVLIRGNDPAVIATNLNWGIACPGGGGSGGSFLLQSGADLTVAGPVDTSGGDGSRTGQIQSVANINVISQAGAGSPGFYRAEAAGVLRFTAAGSVPAYNPALNSGALADRDAYTGSASVWHPTQRILPPQWSHYELEVDTDGNGTVDVTYTDSGAAGTQRADDPLGPVTLRCQAARLLSGTRTPLPGTESPWRFGVGSSTGPGLPPDADGFRFLLTFNRRDFPQCVVRALRVYY
jgi:hypothetical protein